jgi:hypothetical protein
MLKKLLLKLVGRKIAGETGDLSETSRTKIIAVIAVLVAAIPKLSAAWGHPIVIPHDVLEVLAAAGLWTLRDAVDA